ncbi:hypothetical protein UlMin_014639 [Ulmus minor]
MELYYFTIMFGVLMVPLVQIPPLHSPRHISLLSLNLCLAFSICAVVGSIHIGNHRNELNRNHSAKEDHGNRILGAFHAIPIIANSFSSGFFLKYRFINENIILLLDHPKATMAPPVKKQMFKGLCVTYGVIVSTYNSVAISGYWAFGNLTKGTLLFNFLGHNKQPLLPNWFLLITNVFIFLQASAVATVYLQPINEMLENKFADPKFSGRNIERRSIFRSMAVMTATSLAAMFPFFNDIAAMLGAFGCIPLYFILPMVFYNLTFKPSKLGLIFWINTLILGLSLAMAGIGAINSIYQIVSDAKTFHFCANIW